MPNDAKFGLVVGVGLVIVIAVVFYRKDPSAVPTLADSSPASVSPAVAPSGLAGRGQHRPTRAKAVARTESSAQRHTVADGDTLQSLAKHYYGSEDKSEQIMKANADVLSSSEELKRGVELVIPELAEANAN